MLRARSPAVLWAAAIVAVIAVGAVASRTGADRPVQDAAQVVLTPLARAFHGLTQPIGDLFSGLGSYGGLRDENRRLRQQVEELDARIAQLQGEQLRAQQMSDLQRVEQMYPRERFLQANVVLRDPNSAHDAIAIDRGSTDGVQVGMAVVGRGGAIVGTVIAVDARLSWVALIDDPRSNINVAIQETGVTGVAVGGSDHVVRLQFVPQTGSIAVGQTVVTSGLGGMFKSGIVVGKVSRVEGQPQDMFRKATIEPAAGLDALSTVLVLTSYVPQKVNPP